MIRMGQGYDCHRFCEGDHIFIGGVKIPFSKTVLAHSDGDVLLHAITDALLGALALGDIGQHFPDSDPKFKGISSVEILKHVVNVVQQKQYRIGNVDSTVITEAPKLSPHIQHIRQSISDVLQINVDYISVKATTNEKMGWLGRGEGIAAIAVATLYRDLQKNSLE